MSRISLINRGLSLLVCLIYVFNFDFATRGLPGFLGFAVSLCIPLSLIWYGNAIGSEISSPRQWQYPRITVPTPGWLVASAGWFFLVGMPLIARWAKDSA